MSVGTLGSPMYDRSTIGMRALFHIPAEEAPVGGCARRLSETNPDAQPSGAILSSKASHTGTRVQSTGKGVPSRFAQGALAILQFTLVSRHLSSGRELPRLYANVLPIVPSGCHPYEPQQRTPVGNTHRRFVITSSAN